MVNLGMEGYVKLVHLFQFLAIVIHNQTVSETAWVSIATAASRCASGRLVWSMPCGGTHVPASEVSTRFSGAVVGSDRVDKRLNAGLKWYVELASDRYTVQTKETLR